jgi:tRNA (cmo5U34)-methyltransferase
MTLDAKSYETQRWHSTEYVESWMANQDREERRSFLRKKLVSWLPFELEASIRLLDLGAGGGALSQEILSAFPKARIVCQDFSEVMLDHARQHLAKFTGRVTFVRSDLTTPEWTKAISGTFEAVASSLVMHTVPSRVREIYGEVFGLTKPGGYCLVADITAPPGPILEKAFLRWRLKSRQARIKTETGVEKSLEEVEQELREKRRIQGKGFPERARNPLRGALTLVNHLDWLRQAGFDEVDCLWKDLNQAIIGGFKDPG